jgi:hypothetical protein
LSRTERRGTDFLLEAVCWKVKAGFVSQGLFEWLAREFEKEISSGEITASWHIFQFEGGEQNSEPGR